MNNTEKNIPNNNQVYINCNIVMRYGRGAKNLNDARDLAKRTKINEWVSIGYVVQWLQRRNINVIMLTFGNKYVFWHKNKRITPYDVLRLANEYRANIDLPLFYVEGMTEH